MKLPYPLPLPRREDGTLFPAALALLLALLLVFQLVIVDPVDLPEPMVGGGGPAAQRPFLADPVAAPAQIAQADVFSPARTAAAGPGAVASGPLGGSVVAGSVTIGGRSYAMVIAPGGRITRLSPGGSINGWRLARLSAGGARFTRGTERVDLPFGGQAPQAAAADEDTGE